MKHRRAVITGLGIISPNAIGRRAFWDALKEGRSGVRHISLFDVSGFPTRIAGQVTGFNPGDYIESRKARRMARFSQFAVASALMAMKDASLDRKLMGNKNVSVILGVSTSAMDLIENQHKIFLEKGYRSIMPFGIMSATPNVGTGEVVGALGIDTGMLTVATGCASGLDAIGLGFRMVSCGEKKIVLAGGADAPITPLILAGLSSSRIMSARNDEPEKASRPFDLSRDGGVLSEGGGILVIEELTSALSRGAAIYGEIAGYGEASSPGAGNPGDGFRKAMEKALLDANMPPGSVDFISAHAPSDILLDREETRAIREVFGERACRIPVSSIKSMVGNPFGSAGILQVAGGLLAINEATVSPTINYDTPDPSCDLDYVPNTARRANVETVLVNSHGFGGSNSALLLRKAR